MAQIAVSKIESVTQMWDRAELHCYYSHLETLLKTDRVLKIFRPKWIDPLDKPISIPPPVTSKLGAIDFISRMLNDTGF